MKKALSVILSIFICIFLICFMLLLNIKNNLSFADLLNSYSSSNEISYEKESNGLFYPEDKVIVQTQFNSDFLMSSNGLYDNIISELEKNNVKVDNEFIESIMKDNSVKKYLNDFIDDYLDYATGSSAELKIDNKNTIDIVNKIADKYEEYYNIEINRDDLNTELEESLPQVLNDIENGLKETVDVTKNENYGFVKIYQLFTGNILWIVCLGIIVLLIVLIAVISKSIKTTLFSSGIPSIISGCLFVLLGIAILGVKGIAINAMMAYISSEKLIMFIDSVATNIGLYMRNEGIIVFILGIVLTTVAVFVKDKIDSKEKVSIA